MEGDVRQEGLSTDIVKFPKVAGLLKRGRSGEVGKCREMSALILSAQRCTKGRPFGEHQYWVKRGESCEK
jgi:hypothetical protein